MLAHDNEWTEELKSVGQCLHAWSMIETDLAALFVTLHDKPIDAWTDPLRATFEAVLSFETRLAMIHATVMADERCAEYAPHFNSLKNKLTRCYKKRHEVAHFTLVRRQSGNTGAPVHAIRPFFKWADFITDSGNELTHKEIDERTGRFLQLSRRVRAHVRYILLTRGRTPAGSEQPDDPLQLLQIGVDP